jgi:iron complex outermembrane recepter protein
MKSLVSRRAVAASLLLGASPLALAQEAPQTLETVIVTGVGPQRETDEMIGNASAINRDELVQKLSGTLGNTLAGEPGVSTTFFGQGASRPVLRGLGAERVLVLTNGIGAIDASAASPDHQVATDGIDAEKIEILRGPAALAYGGQAIGGVINVIDGLIVEDLPDRAVSFDGLAAINSVNEGTEAAGKARFSTGPFVLTLSASTRDFGDYDIPGLAESAAARAAEEAEHLAEGESEEEHEEHEEVRDTMENSFLQTDTYAAGLSWVGEDAFFGVGIRQQHSSYGLPGHAHHEEEEGAGADEEEAHEEGFPFIELEQTRYDLRGGVNLDFGPFTKVAGNLSVADYEHTEFEAPGEPGTIYSTEGTEGRVELGHAFGYFAGATGFQFLDKDLGSEGEESFLTPTSTKNVGVFHYETLELEDESGLEGGIRFDRTELYNALQGDRSFDLFSASLGAHKHWTSGWFAGVQLGYTERAPNESELFADGAHLATNQYEIGNIDLDKESGTNLEATLRWENDWLSLGGNVYYTDFDGFIYLTPGSVDVDGAPVDELDSFPIYLFQQQGAQFTGAEIQGEARFPDGVLGADWTTTASLDFVDGELEDGSNIPYLPPLTLHASLDADWGMWSAGATLTAAAEQDDPGAGNLPTDGYFTAGLHATIDLAEMGFGQQGTHLFVEGRNLTDEEVRYATSVLKEAVPAPGRNMRMGVRLSF